MGKCTSQKINIDISKFNVYSAVARCAHLIVWVIAFLWDGWFSFIEQKNQLIQKV